MKRFLPFALFAAALLAGRAALSHPQTGNAPQTPVTIQGATETPDQWIALGRRIHGGFGSYIALGIRIGLDANRRLKAKPRDLDVTYQNGSAPCPCVADGLMISTYATPGQNTLHMDAVAAPKTAMGIAIIKRRDTGETLRYSIPASALPMLNDANKLSEGGRYDAVMSAPEDEMYTVEEVPAPK